jgi:hypothetical protein
MIKFEMKYGGRTYRSERDLARAMERDMKAAATDELKSMARRSGLTVKSTTDGFEVEGSPDAIQRFQRKLK